jgi:hypothetical protein
VLGKAVVGDDEGSTRLEPPVHLGQRASTLLLRDEMQGQDAGRRIERPLGRAVDIAFMEIDARCKRTEHALGQSQHLGRWIDAAKTPSRPRRRECFQLQSAARAKHEHMGVVRRSFRKENTRHLLQPKEARHLPHRAFCIACHRLRIGEVGQRRTTATA